MDEFALLVGLDRPRFAGFRPTRRRVRARDGTVWTVRRRALREPMLSGTTMKRRHNPTWSLYSFSGGGQLLLFPLTVLTLPLLVLAELVAAVFRVDVALATCRVQARCKGRMLVWDVRGWREAAREVGTVGAALAAGETPTLPHATRIR
jgi:hypothetical protein